MKIEVWSDYACPFCYIGKERLEKALDQFSHKEEVELVFKSFELDPAAPKEMNHDVHDMLAAKYGMSREQAVAMNDNIARQAEDVGLSFAFDTMKLTNTFDAHRLAQYASKHGKMNKLTKELFQAYFSDSRHLGDTETLVELAVKVGLDRQEVLDVLAGDDYADEVRTDEREARELGVNGVPFFVIDRKYAVSGAQSSERFLQTLQTVWNESQPLKRLDDSDNGNDTGVCSDGSCSIQ